MTAPIDLTPPFARATPDDLAHHAAKVASDERVEAQHLIRTQGQAVLWTGRVVCTTLEQWDVVAARGARLTA